MEAVVGWRRGRPSTKFLAAAAVAAAGGKHLRDRRIRHARERERAGLPGATDGMVEVEVE